MIRAKKYISFLLLLVLCEFIIPKELIHNLIDHHDTEDIKSVPDAPFSIDHQHTHCDFLKINVPLYFAEFNFAQAPIPFTFFDFIAFSTQNNLGTSQQILSLRGPPSIFPL